MWKIEKELKNLYNYKLLLKRMKGDPLLSISESLESIRIPVQDGGIKEGVLLQFSDTSSAVKAELFGEKVRKDAAFYQVNRIFLWERSLHKIFDHFSTTDLAPLFKCFAGVPLALDFELYGCLMKTIIHQQLNMKFAYTLTTRFVQTYGEQVDGAWFYPAPEKVAALTTFDLQQLQFSKRKAEYVIDTSKLIEKNNLNLNNLIYKRDEEIIQELTSIRGIGPWTAQCFLLFGLGRENLLPAGDIGIQNGLKKLWGRDHKPSVEEIKERGKQWSPYASYAAFYIWLSTEFPEYCLF
ncbi:DNA-3-methyladenine glycosylase family protein [Alteribacillus bidgolensis]|uniref:DNA-3-methyladenine glycosylase II n=1 Tax=Alteribacillus bidgolensis TaxID=930129 RepID=A0A1G8LAV6_9BACI|nr:DNA-3-methyladenine glycosylase [Alteribacillus bidgolensis]SDI52761.1 DNA-3-methyladenine glycosylase II [Alteribacillus bidgolensis]